MEFCVWFLFLFFFFSTLRRCVTDGQTDRQAFIHTHELVLAHYYLLTPIDLYLSLHTATITRNQIPKWTEFRCRIIMTINESLETNHDTEGAYRNKSIIKKLKCRNGKWTMSRQEWIEKKMKFQIAEQVTWTADSYICRKIINERDTDRQIESISFSKCIPIEINSNGLCYWVFCIFECGVCFINIFQCFVST